MSKFLSEEWCQQVTDALNSHEGFKNALGAADLGVQFEASDGPDGDINYYLSASGGTAAVSQGELESPDVTVKQSYETAAKISQGELNTQTAFMTGKLKVSGNLAKLMMHQAAVAQFAAATGELDVDY